MKTPSGKPGAKPAGTWGDLALRGGVALVLIPIVLLDTWLGGIWFEAMLAALGALIALEWCAMVHAGNRMQIWLHVAIAVFAAMSAQHGSLPTALAGIAMLTMASGFLTVKEGRKLDIWVLSGIAYVGLPVAALILLRADPSFGFLAIVWLFAVVWLADTLAYFAGKSIGGPRLAPKISPKKTWAGMAGAVAGGVLGSMLVTLMAGLEGAFVLALLGAVFAVIEQIGDLFESAVKRAHGVKDSGSIIPGHGGVLDRVDGLIAAGVIAFVFGATRGGIDLPATGLLQW